MSIVVLAMFSTACSSPPAEVDFCEVLTTPAKFEGQDISTEVVIHPHLHGWTAYGMSCGSRAMPVSRDWDKSPESSAAEQMVDQVFDKPDPRGVAVQVVGRIQLHSPGKCCCNGLLLLSAGDSRIVALPVAALEPQTDSSVPPPCD